MNLKLKITTSDSSFIAYQNISLCDFQEDSVKSSSYWLRTLSTKTNTISVYKNKLEYCIFYDLESDSSTCSTIEHQIDLVELSLSIIKSIELIEHSQTSALEGITNTLTLQDTAWLKNKPVEVLYGNYATCFYSIFVHVSSPSLSAELQKLTQFEREYHQNAENDKSLESSIQLIENQLERIQRFGKLVVYSGCSD